MGVLVVGGVMLFGCSLGRGASGPSEEAAIDVAQEAPAPAAPTVPEDESVLRVRLREEFGLDSIGASDVRTGSWPQEFVFLEPWPYVTVDGGLDAVPPGQSDVRTSDLVPGEAFVETAEIRDTTVGPCRLHHRQVRDVDVGIPGEAGERIESQLRRAADPANFFDYEGTFEVFDHPEVLLAGACEQNLAGGTTDYLVIEQVGRFPCALPDRDVRCFLLSRYVRMLGSGGSASAAGFVLVLDRATGELVPRSELVSGLSAEELARLVELLVRDHLAAGRRDEGEEHGSDPTVMGSIVPTVEGLAYAEMQVPRLTPLDTQAELIVMGRDLVDRAVAHRVALPADEREAPFWWRR